MQTGETRGTLRTSRKEGFVNFGDQKYQSRIVVKQITLNEVREKGVKDSGQTVSIKWVTELAYILILEDMGREES